MNLLSRPESVGRIPLWLKIAYTGFLAVMIPVYWMNYVFNLLSDEKPQQWMPPLAYLGVWIAALIGIAATPVHFLLKKTCKRIS